MLVTVAQLLLFLPLGFRVTVRICSSPLAPGVWTVREIKNKGVNERHAQMLDLCLDIGFAAGPQGCVCWLLWLWLTAEVSCPHVRFTALENQGSLCQLILLLFFIVPGHVQCRESWHLPLREQCPSQPRASKHCRRMKGQCCGAVTQLWVLTALTHCRRGCEQAGHRNLREMGRKDLVVCVRLHISSTARCVGVLAASGGKYLKLLGRVSE